MSSSRGVICSVKAGKCRFEDDIVHPCLEKGTLRLYQGMDELLCVQWHPREDDNPEDSFYVFADAYLEKVRECTDGEVYALKFTGNDHRVLYWMQETHANLIKRFIDKVNRTIGCPDIPRAI